MVAVPAALVSGFRSADNEQGRVSNINMDHHKNIYMASLEHDEVRQREPQRSQGLFMHVDRPLNVTVSRSLEALAACRLAGSIGTPAVFEGIIHGLQPSRNLMD